MALQHLTDPQLTMLDLERSWWQDGRSKDQLIAERLGMDSTEYYFALSVLIHDEAAYAHDPLLVRRLRRVSRGTPRRRTMHGPVLRGLVPQLDPA